MKKSPKQKKLKNQPGYGKRTTKHTDYARRKKQVFIYRTVIACLVCVILFFGLRAFVHALSGLKNVLKTSVSTDSKQVESLTLDIPVKITVSFTGDCTLGTDENFASDSGFNAYYKDNGPDYFLKNVRSIFGSDDLTIVNFEGTLTTSDIRSEKEFAFKGDPKYASILSDSSVNAANLANNHSHDYGKQSYTDTVNNLESAGITTFGYDDVAVINARGIKVGLIGINGLKNHAGLADQLRDNIAEAKSKGAHLIIVTFHWGTEKESAPSPAQIELAHLAIDEGAHVVVGHHPHVIQPIENYNGRYIAYSMGNFCFGGNSAPEDMDTFIFQQTFTVSNDGVKADNNINLIPCSISSESGFNNYQPTPVDGERAEQILNRIHTPIS